MINATASKHIGFSAQQAWAILEDFGNIMAWAPGIDKVDVIGEGIGMIRRIHIDGLEEPIDEVLATMDSSAKTLSYTIPKGLPLPLKDYSATATVTAIDDGHCEISFRSNCMADGISDEEASQLLSSTYEQLIGWIEAHLQTNA